MSGLVGCVGCAGHAVKVTGLIHQPIGAKLDN